MLGAYIVSSRRLVTAGLSEWRQTADRSGPGDPRQGSWRLKVNAHSSYVISMQRQSCATRAPIRVRNFMEEEKPDYSPRRCPRCAQRSGPSPRLEKWAKEYEKLCPGPGLQMR